MAIAWCFCLLFMNGHGKKEVFIFPIKKISIGLICELVEGPICNSPVVAVLCKYLLF